MANHIVYLLKACHILKPVGGCFLWIPHASSDIETPYGLLELVKFATDIAGFVKRRENKNNAPRTT